MSSQKLASMAEKFLDSSKVLSNTDKVEFYFVIIYLLGTAVELYLKAIITSIGNPPQHHKLTELANLAKVDAPQFLKPLTHYLYWKSKYHEGREEFEKKFYHEESTALDFDEIMSYVNTLKNHYLNI